MAELAAALEVQSEHPLAAAILAWAAQRLGHARSSPAGAASGVLCGLQNAPGLVSGSMLALLSHCGQVLAGGMVPGHLQKYRLG